jgi:gas vesicle protein
MKLAGKVFFGLAVLGIIVFLSGVSFAQMASDAGKDSSAMKAKHDARIQLFKDAAAALQQTNPDLAKGLSDLVNEDANGLKEKLTKDSPEWKARHEARILLFKDAAAALQQSHPDLAKGLNEMESKHKKKM